MMVYNFNSIAICTKKFGFFLILFRVKGNFPQSCTYNILCVCGKRLIFRTSSILNVNFDFYTSAIKLMSWMNLFSL